MKLGHKPLELWAQPPNLRLGQEENCPQQERTHRESGTYIEWALRERKHQGGPTPDQASGHPGLGLSIPTLFGEPGPPHLEMSQATEEMEFYFHKYRGNTHSRVAKRGAGASNLAPRGYPNTEHRDWGIPKPEMGLTGHKYSPTLTLQEWNCPHRGATGPHSHG